jgi:hypothetical protein
MNAHAKKCKDMADLILGETMSTENNSPEMRAQQLVRLMTLASHTTSAPTTCPRAIESARGLLYSAIVENAILTANTARLLSKNDKSIK